PADHRRGRPNPVPGVPRPTIPGQLAYGALLGDSQTTSQPRLAQRTRRPREHSAVRRHRLVRDPPHPGHHPRVDAVDGAVPDVRPTASAQTGHARLVYQPRYHTAAVVSVGL